MAEISRSPVDSKHLVKVGLGRVRDETRDIAFDVAFDAYWFYLTDRVEKDITPITFSLSKNENGSDLYSIHSSLVIQSKIVSSVVAFKVYNEVINDGAEDPKVKELVNKVETSFGTYISEMKKGNEAGFATAERDMRESIDSFDLDGKNPDGFKAFLSRLNARARTNFNIKNLEAFTIRKS
jgi:hypothetical protein